MSFTAESTGTRRFPDESEIREAYAAGYRSIDRNLGFAPGFTEYLEARGYELRADLPCTSADRGRHGHLAECRWFRRETSV